MESIQQNEKKKKKEKENNISTLRQGQFIHQHGKSWQTNVKHVGCDEFIKLMKLKFKQNKMPHTQKKALQKSIDIVTKE